MTARKRPRVPVLDPNVYERSVLYVSAAELFDPRPARRPTVPTSSPGARRKETAQ